MNEFLIKFANAENALNQMRQVESAIRSESEEISEIRRGLRSEFGGKDRILHNLQTVTNRMSELGDSAKNFGNGLESILNIYNAVEQSLLGGLEESGKRGSAYAGRAPAPGLDPSRTGDKDTGPDQGRKTEDKDGKKDLIAGAGAIGAATLGAQAGGEETPGAPAGDIADGGAGAVAGTGDPGEAEGMPAAGDIEDVRPALEQLPEGVTPESFKNFTWEEFLESLPVEIREALPEAALEYIHQLFDLFSSLATAFGNVRFLDPQDMAVCGIWATFYTLLNMYLFQNIFPGMETAGEGITTMGDEIVPTDTEPGEEDPTDPTDPAGKSGTGKDGESGTMPSDKDDSSGGSHGGGSSGGGGSHGGGSGGGSHGGGSGGGGGFSGDDYSLPGETTADPSSVDQDATGEYLSGLFGDETPSSVGTYDEPVSALSTWGQKAAESLAESGAGQAASAAAENAAAAGSGVIGRTARSVVCAALINAGIDAALHGAGAVGAVLGDKDDLFKGVRDSDLV